MSEQVSFIVQPRFGELDRLAPQVDSALPYCTTHDVLESNLAIMTGMTCENRTRRFDPRTISRCVFACMSPILILTSFLRLPTMKVGSYKSGSQHPFAVQVAYVHPEPLCGHQESSSTTNLYSRCVSRLRSLLG